jgi:pimeloyl-ACP methyl ester carboxylesterase
MSRKSHFQASDLHALSRLAVSAIESVIDLVESMHGKLVTPAPSGAPAGGIADTAYAKVRALTSAIGRWTDSLLKQPVPSPGERVASDRREAVLAAINGLIGDYLAEAGNPLAIEMRLRVEGQALPLESAALAAALPMATGKILVLVHGLCRCDLQWRRNGHDHGEALARDLGYTALYLHYNSGLHVSTNGRRFAEVLELLVRHWPVPVEEMAILAHSMGGLVARSACHYGEVAENSWPRFLKKMIFLGTPHHGAPLERGGNWLNVVLGRSVITAPFARLGRMRSAGITDLRYGNLLDEDWEGRDRFEPTDDCRQLVPLPRGVQCYAIAGTTGRRTGDMRDRLLGDGLIPLATALGQHESAARTLPFPKSRQWIAYGVHHLDLLSRVEVCDKLRDWLARAPAAKRIGR